jgi:ribosomal protein S18 acetylase RimI-like enzyme
MNIIACDQARFPALVDFIVRINPKSEHHIGYFGASPADIRSAIDELAPPQHERFVLAYDGEQLVGILGAEVDAELGRAWLYGPLVSHSDWQPVADSLYTAIQPRIAAGIHEHELFCDAHNQECQRFAQRHTFTQISDAAILHFPRAQLAHIPLASAADLEDRYVDQFTELHSRLFPRTYFSARQIIDKRDDHANLLIATADGSLQGYIFAKVDPATHAGYIDYLGVAEDARRRGIGRELVGAALHWMLADSSIQHVDLTVTASNQAALGLYTSMGFEHERTLQAYRKQVA